MKEPKAMAEIHKIREQLYEKRKNMSPEEKIKNMEASVEKFERETGIKLRRLEHANR